MIKPRNYWTKERCAEEALKYNNKTKFSKENPNLYYYMLKHGWYFELTKHMNPLRIRKWNFENCQKIALLYEHKGELLKHESGLCKAAKRHGWYDEITKHFKIPLSNLKRLIYLIEFPNKICYIGLTYNFEKRIKNHLINRRNYKISPVKKYMEINNIKPINIKKLSNYICVEDAVNLEIYYINLYKKMNYILLNTNKGGGIGAIKGFTYNECKNAAKKYKTIKEFKNSVDVKYLRKIYSMKWLELINKIQKIRWNYEKCVEEAKKYNYANEFMINSIGAYIYSNKHKFYKELKNYWKPMKMKWSYDKCIEIVKKYKSYSEFIKNENNAYRYAIRHNILENIKSIFKY